MGKFVGNIYNGVVGFGFSAFATATTLYILTLIVDVAPIIAMMGASFLVMSFYFLSILVLYVVIPFACVFAFSTGELRYYKKLSKAYIFIVY